MARRVPTPAPPPGPPGTPSPDPHPPPRPALSPCLQKRPSQPPSQLQPKALMPSMHVPCPQHGLSHGCSEGRDAHWSPSATWEEGRHWCLQRGGAPRPAPSLQRLKKKRGGGGVVGRGTAAWGLERTHRRTWTSRPAVKKRDTVKGLSPCISIQGAQGVPPESGPGRAGEGRASGQRGVYPCLLPAAGATAL